jgi:hypothetical protein
VEVLAVVVSLEVVLAAIGKVLTNNRKAKLSLNLLLLKASFFIL